MKIKNIKVLTFGAIDNGDVFYSIYDDPSFSSIKLLIEEGIYVPFNAVFIADGTQWNYDDNDEVIVIKKKNYKEA